MKTEVALKREHIIETAVRRFSHFGIHKTTLTEIADDLSISKPLLFYYFQDKNALITAVASAIIKDFLIALNDVLQGARSIDAGLTGIVQVKREHFKKYFLLAIQGDSSELQKNAGEMSELYLAGRKEVTTLIANFLQKGIDAEELRPVDPVKTSQLLLDTMSAFEYSVKRKNAIPVIEDIDEVFDKQLEILHLFINGLKQSGCKH